MSETLFVYSVSSDRNDRWEIGLIGQIFFVKIVPF